MRKQIVAGAALLALWPLAPYAQSCRHDNAHAIAIAVAGSHQNPCWSPDGQRLAFTRFTTRYNTGTGIVYTVAATGGTPSPLTPLRDAQSVNLPGQCWQTPGHQVAYTSDVVDRDEVYLVPAAGGVAKRITRRPGFVAFEPSVSPILSDGSQWVVFESHTESNAVSPGELWKVRVSGADLTRLTTGKNDRQPQWSPKGDKIVFQREVGNDRWDVFTLDVNTGAEFNVTRQVDESNTDPSWSPSGQYIVYSAGGPGIKIANVFVIPAAGGTRLQVTSSCGLDGAPGWSADGSRIAFESAPFDPDESGSTTLWWIDAPVGVK